MTRRAPTWAVLLLCAAGCGQCGQTTAGPAAKGPAKGAPKPAATGLERATVTGIVRLAAGAELPSYPPDQMEKRILVGTERGALPESCTPPKLDDRAPVRATPEGLLASVVVAGSNFSRQPVRAPISHEIVIEDCRLKPKTVTAMKGDQLRIRSTVSYPFMPSFGDTTGKALRTLIPGQTYDVPLDKPGVFPVLCGFTAPCGRSDVVVMMHPVHSVTDDQGKFRIDAFPAGETVTLSAWHPLFQESKTQVRVEPGETKSVELTLTPLAPAPPADKPGTKAAAEVAPAQKRPQKSAAEKPAARKSPERPAASPD